MDKIELIVPFPWAVSQPAAKRLYITRQIIMINSLKNTLVAGITAGLMTIGTVAHSEVFESRDPWHNRNLVYVNEKLRKAFTRDFVEWARSSYGLTEEQFEEVFYKSCKDGYYNFLKDDLYLPEDILKSIVKAAKYPERVYKALLGADGCIDNHYNLGHWQRSSSPENEYFRSTYSSSSFGECRDYLIGKFCPNLTANLQKKATPVEKPVEKEPQKAEKQTPPLTVDNYQSRYTNPTPSDQERYAQATKKHPLSYYYHAGGRRNGAPDDSQHDFMTIHGWPSAKDLDGMARDMHEVYMDFVDYRYGVGLDEAKQVFSKNCAKSDLGRNRQYDFYMRQAAKDYVDALGYTKYFEARIALIFIESRLMGSCHSRDQEYRKLM